MKKKRILAVIMAVMMMISLLPSLAFAQTPSGELGGKLKIKGLAAVGITLSADYSKVTPEGLTDDSVSFSWARQTDEKTLTELSTDRTYTVTQDDLGYRLVLTVTALENSGVTGTLSAKTPEAAQTEEEAQVLALEEEAKGADEEAQEEQPEEEDAQIEEEQPEEVNAQIEEEQLEEVIQEEQPGEANEEAQEEQPEEINEEAQEEQSEEVNEEVQENQNTEEDSDVMQIYTESELQLDESGTESASASPEISLKAEPDTLSFQALTAGYDKIEESQTVTITYSGEGTVTLEQPQADHFDIAGTDGTSEYILNSGEQAVFTVQPKPGLDEGTYNDTINFSVKDSPDSMVQITAQVEVAAEKEEEVYRLTPNPAELDFGALEEGYAEAPKAQTVTLTNEGNTTLTLGQPQADSFEVGPISASELNPGETCTFTVCPKMGLTEGTYIDTIVIPNEQQISVMIDTQFTVKQKSIILTGIQAPDSIAGVKNGVEKSEKALGLPSSVIIKTTGGNMKAKVKWDVKDSAYDPSAKEEQKFTVKGTVVLPDGVSNPDDISLITSVEITVNAGRTPKIADPQNNKITGINSEGYTTQSKITFTAVGAGMENESPGAGDVRYVPYKWKVINTNTWDEAPYTATFGITKAGTYTLTVVFNRQEFDGKKWNETGEQDTKQAVFSIAQGNNITATPTPEPDNANAKKAVQTGDTTNIAPFVIILIIAVVCIAGVIIYRRKRK
ncbi:MAG: LPXTG cell wall anchor domain-containing protein [Clostridia bacterium]|nr:LPXTG cell wall anchor domain-containing protein [Clostridia bacterium]MDY5555877.1 LPXTG cell wall anchor domain-containing protein [Blautia sp.]